MRLIHVSDIHIGASPDIGFPWSNARKDDIKETFSDVISKCREVNADLLLISGDLFDHQPLSDELEYVNSLFRNIPDTKIFIVAGSSDYITSNSQVLNFPFAQNVVYFHSHLPWTFAIEHLNVIVHGFSYQSKNAPNSILNSIIPEDDNHIHILLSYANANKTNTLNNIAKQNFSYIALGGRHNMQEVFENKMYYAGSLEPLSKEEDGKHGIIIADINESTKRVEHLEFVPLAKLEYKNIDFTVSADMSEESLSSELTKKVSELGNKNIYTINLNGVKNPDCIFDKYIMSDKIRLLELIDNSTPKYDYIKLSEAHPRDMIGAYIRQMIGVEKVLSDVEKEALYLGVHALIKTQEE